MQVELLIGEAKNKGVRHISLETTVMGRPLYERYGFVNMKDEMELPDDLWITNSMKKAVE